jgi:hypothetical protein
MQTATWEQGRHFVAAVPRFVSGFHLAVRRRALVPVLGRHRTRIPRLGPMPALFGNGFRVPVDRGQCGGVLSRLADLRDSGPNADPRLP